MPSYTTLAVLALAASTVSPALSAPVQKARGQSLSHRAWKFGELLDMMKGKVHKPPKVAPAPPPAKLAETPPTKPQDPVPTPGSPPSTWKTKLWQGAKYGAIGGGGLMVGGHIANAENAQANAQAQAELEAIANSTDSTYPAGSTYPTDSTYPANSTNPTNMASVACPAGSTNPNSGFQGRALVHGEEKHARALRLFRRVLDELD